MEIFLFLILSLFSLIIEVNILKIFYNKSSLKKDSLVGELFTYDGLKKSSNQKVFNVLSVILYFAFILSTIFYFYFMIIGVFEVTFCILK